MNRQLLQLHQIIKKAKQYLYKKINDETITQEDKAIEEVIGHVWNLNELKEQEFYMENQTLIQLGFRADFDEALQAFVEEGFWFVYPLCEIHKTINIRPKKTAKYIKEDDSCLDKITIPVLYLYPGKGNRRLRFEDTYISKAPQPEDFSRIIACAETDYEKIIKDVKNQLKNPFIGNELAIVLKYEEIRQNKDDFVMVDALGNSLLLSAMNNTSLHALTTLPEARLLQQQCALVLFFL